MSSDVAAIILNWNCAEDTIRCARAVLGGTSVPAVIVVDNGSTDGSVARLSTLDEPVTLVETGANLGYAGGMNAGIRAAMDRGARWVWLLNADCVPRPDALAMLLKHAGRFAAGASLQLTSASPDDPDPQPYDVAAFLPGGKVRAFRCAGCAEQAHEVDVVTGAALFADLAWVERVGLLDERFFHYKEEFDFIVRIAAAGGRIGLVCASEVWHERGGSLKGSSPRARYYYHRNEVLYIRKHYDRPLRRLLLAEPVHYKNIARSLAGIVAGGRQRRRAGFGVLAGYWDGVRGVTGPTRRF